MCFVIIHQNPLRGLDHFQSHILEVLDILPKVFLGTSYLHHRRILPDGRLLFFPIIIKFLIMIIPYHYYRNLNRGDQKALTETVFATALE